MSGFATHPSAKRAWRERRAALCRRVLAPPPRLSLSEWADRYRVLSRETSASPGRWSTTVVPYLRGIMDACTDPRIREVVVMKSAQVAFTEGVVNNLVGYHIDQDPAPVLVVQPTIEDAENWSKEKLAGMLRDTPRLRGKVKDPRSRASDNTILAKSYPGGHLGIIGANAPRGLRARSRRVVIFDEVDGYPVSAGTEGDPISLGKKRAMTFWNRKIVTGSTPTIKGASRIETAYAASDQRRFYVPCPHCGHPQVLRFANVVWDKEEREEGGLPRTVHRPDTAAYRCGDDAGGCGALIEERDRMRMVAAGEWLAEAPPAPGEVRAAGFHISALYSPFISLAEIVDEFLKANAAGEELLKTFVNTVLGETFELRPDVDTETLALRREAYAAEVPAGVGVLTAGVDVQDDRLELVIKGWGAAEESWLIAHHRILGDTEADDVWQRLDELLFQPFTHEAGSVLYVRAACVDSGFRQARVFEYVKRRQRRGVWATKGIQERTRELVAPAKKKNREGVKLVTIGTYTAKDRVFARLKITKPGPRYMHFPKPRETEDPERLDTTYGDDFYLEQFGAERAEVQRVKGQQARRVYVQIAERNEAIDLEVLAMAALHLLGAGVRDHLEAAVARAQAAGARVRGEGQGDAPPAPPDPAGPATNTTPPPTAAAARRAAALARAQRGRPGGRAGGGWATGWRR